MPAPRRAPDAGARAHEFYRALAEMNQAMVRIADPLQLYAALCRIVVDRGGATMAWVGLVEHDQIRPVAWGGTARAYTEGLVIPLDPPAVESRGPMGTAIATCAPYVCNDFLADPRTLPWRERALGFGVRASAAFPFRRGGVVIGALSLYYGHTDAFDDDVIELMRDMTGDLSFALDHVAHEVQLAEAMRQAEQRGVQLMEREAQLREVVETALDAIITVDAHERVVVFNQAAARMFGVPRDEALGQPLDRFVPPAVRAAHGEYLRRFAAAGVGSRPMGRAREVQAVRANGEAFPMEASISRVGEGDRMLMTVMARDVTQLRQAEKAHLARAAAEAASRAKTAFLSRISHELRTPLNAVLGFAQLMRDDDAQPLSERHREQLARVLQAGAHLRTLIDEMLDISRIEAGELQLLPTQVDVAAAVDEVLQISSAQAQQCQVRIGPVEPSGLHGPVTLRGDASRLRQVLLNLVSNAIKYNRPGGQVQVALSIDDGPLRIVVRDNGLGMTARQQANLFQPFNRLGRERSGVEGTGIGLVLVRQLVGLMGGELRVDSRHGRGTAVTVSLPLQPDAPAAEPALHPAEQPQAEPASDAMPQPTRAELKGRVLYIEDNPINAILVEQLLARWPGVELVLADNGASGIDHARTLQPDVVLLDMQLPDGDGIGVLRRLKADPATRALCVVALSANAMPEQVSAARAAGAEDYWTKPIDFKSFIDGMGRLLGA